MTRAVLLLVLLLGACSAEPRPRPARRDPPAARSRFLAERLRGANISERGPRRYHERDFAALRALGATVVRLLVTSGQVIDKRPPHALIEADLRRIDTLLGWARRHQLYFVLNLHELPGYRYVDGQDNSLWHTPGYRRLVIEFWRRVATRYRDLDDVIAYDILNEPHGTGGTWNALAREVTAAIRAIDRRHTIVVEADDWSWPTGFSTLQPTGDANTVYSPHIWIPNALTSGAPGPDAYPGRFAHERTISRWDSPRYARELRPIVAFQRRHRARIWVGEFGCVRWRKGLERWIADQVALYEGHDWGWAWYGFREWTATNLELSSDPQATAPPPGEPSHLALFRRLLRNGRP